MRQIKITHRAQFRQPIGVLNPLGARLSSVLTIELYETANRWNVRNAETRAQLKQLAGYAGADNAKADVARHFLEQMSEWELWGKPPNEPTVRRIESHEVKAIPGPFGTVYAFLTDEDYTHILHAPNVRPNLKIPNAACGATVPTNAFINNRANVEPTCKACAEVWREHYAQPRPSQEVNA